MRRESIQPFVSKVIPLLAPDIDTDQIAPAHLFALDTEQAYADALFSVIRDRDPDFVFNDPAMAGRKILAAGENFGCGSSRESAVWMLHAFGIRAVIAPSFGPIFFGNALKTGLLPIRAAVADQLQLQMLLRDDPDLELRVDLETCRVDAIGMDFGYSFEIEPLYRELLLSGSDDLDFLRQHLPLVEEYERSRRLHPGVRARLDGSTRIVGWQGAP